jgi:hypothetical protein
MKLHWALSLKLRSKKALAASLIREGDYPGLRVRVANTLRLRLKSERTLIRPIPWSARAGYGQETNFALTIASSTRGVSVKQSSTVSSQ